jgi:hypothetical protein
MRRDLPGKPATAPPRTCTAARTAGHARPRTRRPARSLLSRIRHDRADHRSTQYFRCPSSGISSRRLRKRTSRARLRIKRATSERRTSGGTASSANNGRGKAPPRCPSLGAQPHCRARRSDPRPRADAARDEHWEASRRLARLVNATPQAWATRRPQPLRPVTRPSWRASAQAQSERMNYPPPWWPPPPWPPP